MNQPTHVFTFEGTAPVLIDQPQMFDAIRSGISTGSSSSMCAS